QEPDRANAVARLLEARRDRERGRVAARVLRGALVHQSVHPADRAHAAAVRGESRHRGRHRVDRRRQPGVARGARGSGRRAAVRMIAVALRPKLRSIGRARSVRYALTLPERTVRSVTALAAGLVRETAGVVLPIGVRRGRVYRDLVDATLQLLIERVGE